MESLTSFQQYAIYTSVLLVTLFSFFRLVSFFAIDRFLKPKPELKKKFDFPRLPLLVSSIICILASLLFSLIALYQTSANEAEISENKKSVDILFLIDVSLSMNAVDVYPSRLKRAQDILLRLAPDLVGNRVGIIVFAGSAFSFCPMTTDITAFSDYVNSLGVDMIGKKGTDIASSFKKADLLLSKDKILQNRIIVFISDGENHESKNIPKLNSELMVWGLGTEEGGPIHFGDSSSKSAGFVTNSGGLNPNANAPDLLISKANPELLNQLAKEHNGDFYDLTYESLGAYRLLDKVDSMQKNQTILMQKIRKEDGAETYLLLAVFFFFIERVIRLFFQNKKILAVALCCYLAISPSKSLFAWELDPGGNRIKEGVQSFEEKRYAEAESKFESAEEYLKDDPRLKFNQSDAEYSLGKYKEAIKKNEEIINDPKSPMDLKAKALYNNGNAYYKLNDLKSAKKNYEDALNINPNHLPSKRNLEQLQRKQNQSHNGNNTPKSKQNPSDSNQKPGNDGSDQKTKKKQNEEKTDRENADRMMEHFAPDSILRKKSKEGGSFDNEKFW